jgi:hypothetical protein
MAAVMGGLAAMKLLGAMGGKKALGNTALSAGMALQQGIKGRKLKKEAEAAMPAPEDPEQRRRLNRFDRMARAAQTGTLSSTRREKKSKAFAGATSRAMKAGGGRGGFKKMLELFNQSMQSDNDADRAVGMKYEDMANKSAGEMSQRKLDIQMQKHDEKSAEAAQALQASRQNLSALIGRKAGVNTANPVSTVSDVMKKKKKTAATGEEEVETDATTTTQTQ